VPTQEPLTLDQAAEILARSRKAVEQLVQRDALRVEREVDPESGRTRRVWTTREWIDEYLASPRAMSRSPANLPATTWSAVAQVQASEGAWQRIAEEQALEIVRLKARIAELEVRPDRR